MRLVWVIGCLIISLLSSLTVIQTANITKRGEEDLDYLKYICQPMTNTLHITFHKDAKRLDPIGVPCFAQWNEDNTDYPNPETIECKRHHEDISLSEFNCKARDPALWTRYSLTYQVRCMFIDLNNKGVTKDATNPSWIKYTIPTGNYCSIGFKVIYNSSWVMCWWWIIFIIIFGLLSFCFNIAFKIDTMGYIIATFALLTSETAPIIMLFFYELLHFVSITTCIIFNVIFTIIFIFSASTSAFLIIKSFIHDRIERDYVNKAREYGYDLKSTGKKGYWFVDDPLAKATKKIVDVEIVNPTVGDSKIERRLNADSSHDVENKSINKEEEEEKKEEIKLDIIIPIKDSISDSSTKKEK